MTQKLDWQQSLAEVVTDPIELCNILQLDPIAFLNEHAIIDFALRVPRNFMMRMEKGNLHDPLLKQVLPIKKELPLTPGYSFDPLHEQDANPIPGLLHKYHGRVLVMIAGGCAINCRYCFRRHFAYQQNTPGKSGWEKILNYISADETICEVIYSGGDPLLVKDDMLIALTEKIAEIPHVQTLRIHTRLPIVIPERITQNFLTRLTNNRLQCVFVLHCNHPNEIDDSVIYAIEQLNNAGIKVLNQSVLLRDINDQADVLIALSKCLFSAGALPYYLHMLDAVQGAAHFSVPITTAKKLIKQMSYKLPGYLVPRLVQEKPGMRAKCLLLDSVNE